MLPTYSAPAPIPTPTPAPVVSEPVEDYPIQPQTQQVLSVAGFTSAQLKAIGKEHKVPRYSRMNKTELFEKLQELDLI